MSNLNNLTSTLIVGLSGPSSSGKSTLARLLRTIFNITLPDRTLSLFILHEDDFYKANDQIPVKTFTSGDHGTRELQDWDCASAMDFPLFERVMKHVKTHGQLPDDMFSKEDQNELGKSHVEDAIIEKVRLEAVNWFESLEVPNSSTHFQICILDGFLLYSDPDNSSIPRSITELFDLKLFLRTTLAQTVERRGNRSGYVTLGEFWVDPPGYVEDVVWPNYVQEHGWMFEAGDVDAGEITSRVGGEGISVAPGKGEIEMKELMVWATAMLRRTLENKII